MALKHKFFIIPVTNTEASEKELNHFVETVKAVEIHRDFVAQGNSSFWAVTVTYFETGSGPVQGKKDEGAKKLIDYRDILSKEDFILYLKLKDWRKQQAETEKKPVFNVIHNDQLAKIAETRANSLEALKRIDGIGPGRTEKYGEAILKIVVEHGGEQNEPAGESLQPNPHVG